MEYIDFIIEMEDNASIRIVTPNKEYVGNKMVFKSEEDLERTSVTARNKLQKFLNNAVVTDASGKFTKTSSEVSDFLKKAAVEIGRKSRIRDHSYFGDHVTVTWKVKDVEEYTDVL